VILTIRYQGFETITRSRTLPEATDLDSAVLKSIKQLFAANWDTRRKVRLLGVELSSFSRGPSQLDLLDAGRRERLERLARATDRLRDRFGFSKIQLGGSLGKREEE
jgi:DNA polymerase-4